MAKIDEVLNKIQELKDNTLDWNRDLNAIVDRINNLYFNAEIDHGNYYLTTLEQIWYLDVPKEQIMSGENLHSLTDEEREWFYKYGKFKEPRKFKIANSTHWFINVREQYVRVLINRGSLKEFKGPKEDYGQLYTQYNSEDNKKPTEWVEFKLNKLDDQYSDLRETLQKIMTIFEYCRLNHVCLPGLENIVKLDISLGWGNESAANFRHVIDDEYQETARPEIIKVRKPFKKVDISKETDLISLLKGPGFDEVKWPTSDDVGQYTFDESHEPINFETSKTGRRISIDTNSVTFAFENKLDADNFLFSAIDYINNDNSGIKPSIHLDQPIKITQLEKHYISNKWPMANNAEESAEYERTLTHYFVSVTKFHDTPVFKEEIWEMGIVFELTNKYDFGFHN
jgi:hypothetical protein